MIILSNIFPYRFTFWLLKVKAKFALEEVISGKSNSTKNLINVFHVLSLKYASSTDQNSSEASRSLIEPALIYSIFVSLVPSFHMCSQTGMQTSRERLSVINLYSLCQEKDGRPWNRKLTFAGCQLSSCLSCRSLRLHI